MADLITDRLRYQIGLAYDWTAGATYALVVKKNGWTPAESDVFLADVFVAGAAEVSTGSPGYAGTDRQNITSPTVALATGHAFWSGDAISYPGIPAVAFDTLILYNTVTSDADSWVMAVFALGSQTGNGSAVTINPAASGYLEW